VTHEEEKQWLQSLKAGDEVYVPDRYSHSGPGQIVTISKITATQIAIGEGARETRFDRKNGRERRRPGGSIYGLRHLEPVTDGSRVRIETWRLRSWLVGLVTDHGRTHPPLHVMRAMKGAHDGAVAGSDPTDIRRAAAALVAKLPVSSDWFAISEVNALRRALGSNGGLDGNAT
jgi:hypothetical protein